jgi:multiple sugar transport system permease protein
MSLNQAMRRQVNGLRKDLSAEELTPGAALRIIGVAAFVSLVLVLTLFPLYWTVNTSFKQLEAVITFPPNLAPPMFTLDGYLALFGQARADLQYSNINAFDAFFSSISISVGSTAVAMLLGIPAGYAYARDASKIGGKHAAFWILSIRMFPPIAPILPLFFIYRQFGLVGTRIGVVLLYLTFNVPLVVWLMRSFFRDVPEALEEAAMIDGYSRLQAFYKVTLPLVAPGIVATMLLAWVFAWNEFQFALVFTRGSSQTYTVLFQSFESGQQTLWNQMAALSTLAMLPVIAIAVFLQKRLVRGLTLGAVKG